MSSEFYRQTTLRIGARRTVKGVARGIRLYCEQSGASWCLQIRGPQILDDYEEGKAFMVSSATLTRADLEALRDAISTMLLEDA